MQRELKAAIARMVKSDLAFKDAVAEFKKRYIQRALELNDGDTKRAAKSLGMKRDNLISKAKKFKLLSKNNPAEPRKRTTRAKNI